ncbi:hypothetical protein [uncultured Olegusella sp.]|uniref:hypothetical protein n=1 Tax=uncultured Olegusella sp. TaxID=1979846 RepID=UPI002628ABE1|nr:hypothetical protein [uncultured Olegusella sp.]
MEQSATLAIMVTYQPTCSTVRLLETFIDQGQSFVVVDNGSNATSSIADIELLCRKTKGEYKLRWAELISLNVNRGLAHAQNVGILKAVEFGAEGVFFFDQDSNLPDCFFKGMVEEYNRLSKIYPLGILAPNLYDKNLHQFGRYARLTGNSYQTVHDIEKPESVSFVVSSASFMPVSVFEQGQKLFASEFFIDQVDTEWSLRMLSEGKAIVVTNRLTFTHTIGDRSEHHFLGLTIRPNHHGPMRKFYIFRNGRRTMIDYGRRFPGFKKLMTFRLIHDALGVVLYEQQKGAKIKAMWKGWCAGKAPAKDWKNYEG